MNLAGTSTGLLLAPRRTLRAFVRGRRSRSLYGQPFEPLLARTVAEARRDTGVDAAASRVRAGDLAWLALAWLVGAAVGLILLTMVTALLPLALVTSWLRPATSPRS